VQYGREGHCEFVKHRECLVKSFGVIVTQLVNVSDCDCNCNRSLLIRLYDAERRCNSDVPQVGAVHGHSRLLLRRCCRERSSGSPAQSCGAAPQNTMRESKPYPIYCLNLVVSTNHKSMSCTSHLPLCGRVVRRSDLIHSRKLTYETLLTDW
jgi:hypothetical protein